MVRFACSVFVQFLSIRNTYFLERLKRSENFQKLKHFKN